MLRLFRWLRILWRHYFPKTIHVDWADPDSEYGYFERDMSHQVIKFHQIPLSAIDMMGVTTAIDDPVICPGCGQELGVTRGNTGACDNPDCPCYGGEA